ncbi:MAG: nuclear transport factor 2 family protein [Pseudonocardiaceae bacterium]
MPSLDSEVAAPPAQLDEVAQRAEIGALLDRYLLSLDENRIDDGWSQSIFTADARVEFPVSHHEGVDGLATYHREALAKFARTQHLNSGAVIDLDGDRATIRANLISTHVHRSAASPQGTDRAPLFTTGTYVDGDARRTTHGWRFRRLSFRLVWVTGSPPR